MDQNVTAPGSAAPSPVNSPTSDSSTGGDFTAAQQTQMAEWAVKDGLLTREQVNEALKAGGIELLPEPANPAAAEIDAQFPPASAVEFDFPMLQGNGMSDQEAGKIDAISRAVLNTARFDRERGSSLAKEVHRVAERTAQMTEGEMQLYARSENLKLEKLWGDRAKEKINMARALVREIEEKHPGSMALLDQSRAGSSALVVAMLAAQAEVLWKRQGNK